MTDSQIKATKPVPARSMCSYPEAVMLLSKEYDALYVEEQHGAVLAISLMFERDRETVQADLERGHV